MSKKNKMLIFAGFIIFVVILIVILVFNFAESDKKSYGNDTSSNVSSEKQDENVSSEKQDENEVDDKPTTDKDENNNSSSSRIIVSNPDDVTVLLNKTHALPDGWAPSDLVVINSNTGGTNYLRSEAAQAWEELRIASLNDGLKINAVSTYRSQQYQYDLYNYYMSFDAENAPYYSAYPRTSEHEMGLAIDVSYDGSLHDDLQNSLVGSWMNENGWKYGWILRYPEGKEEITGYIFEPWHYRYVGRNLASKLYHSGLTMEEYYDGI